jgi:hypothetical protein
MYVLCMSTVGIIQRKKQIREAIEFWGLDGQRNGDYNDDYTQE